MKLVTGTSSTRPPLSVADVWPRVNGYESPNGTLCRGARSTRINAG